MNMPASLSIPVLIVGMYIAAYALIFPWYCGRDTRRLLMCAGPLPFVVLALVWLHVQRGDHVTITLGIWSLHWLWYALPIVVLSELSALHSYLWAQGLRYRDLWQQ
ncbi:MAG: hypothetical protein EA401_03450 [Planctomycetota bacterium]|nr:MAG: hypothetical protein EA401_03450 [Planctomycetota bacterium]